MFKPLKIAVLWLVFLIPSLLIELMCYILAPVVALFTRTKPRTDTVKRLDRQVLTLPRDYLIKPLMWFQTQDNAVDEWWYGAYNEDHWFKFAREATQTDYDSKAWFRWYCRVMWLWRNCGYGFLYNLLGRDIEGGEAKREHGIKDRGLWWLLTTRSNSFQWEAQVPLYGERHISINVGWKTHKGFPRALYANRFIGFRKYK